MSLDRTAGLEAVRTRREPWDLVIVGGGATGLGAAVDAASRGHAVVLFEQADFAAASSSRSTKLVHGGVRYLQQGNVALVMEALRERGRLLRNAPHLVRDLGFVVPSYAWWQSPFYGIGLKMYDALAGRYGFGRSRFLSKQDVVEHIPSIQQEGLLGGIRYFDGQFDDARLAVALARTAVSHGAVCLNYVPVESLVKDPAGLVVGVRVRDAETDRTYDVGARVVVNATGAFADRVRRLDDPDAAPVIAPSQGVHLVFDRSVMPGDSAIMVPSTDDGRVMFAIPWYDVVVVGTTDTPIETVELEPKPFAHEIDFLLRTASRYLAHAVEREDVRSVFVGIRPLVRAGDAGPTAALSRDHTVLVAPGSGLVTVAGGKWTTYRKMAEDIVDTATDLAGLERRACVTRHLPIHGFHPNAASFGRLAPYGSDAPAIAAAIERDAEGARPVHERIALTRAEVEWAVRHEMARTVDDVLARRSRALLFDARAASEAAPAVAETLARELARERAWAEAQVEAFRAIAASYVPAPA